MKISKQFPLFLLLILLALTACGRLGDQPPPATEEAAPPVAATPAEQEASPTTPPEPSPSAEAAEHDHSGDDAAPTAETQAAATTAPTPSPEGSAAERLGLLRFRDATVEGQESVVRAGGYQLLLQGVEAPEAGSHYELWLVDDSFNTINLGPFTPGGEVAGSVAQDLLGHYSGAFVSIEADGEDDGKIGPLALNGVIPSQSLLHIRHVVTAFETNPDGKAFLIGAEEQLLLAIEHTGYMQDELAADNLAEAHRHAEHVVNILDGESGANFGDLDGDGVPQNPGDGFGVRAYLQGAKQHAQLAAEAPGATAEVQLHAGHVQITGDNMLGWLDEAIAEALRVIASDSAAEAQPAADTLAQLLDLTYAGQDVDSDGAVAPIPGEGGWQTAYEHALNMGSFEFFDADAATATQQEAAPGSPPAGDAPPVDDDAPPAATEAASEPPPAVSITMANFAYQPGDISVPAGTAVTWVNEGSARHSATAADGSFDTGLLDAGQEATLILDTPGTYIYYCTLHGSPDGGGMAATITVTE